MAGECNRPKTPPGCLKDVSPSLIILATNCCQLYHTTERKKKVVCGTATRVAVGFRCEIHAASSRCPPLQESVRNLELSSMWITGNVGNRGQVSHGRKIMKSGKCTRLMRLLGAYWIIIDNRRQWHYLHNLL